MIKAILITLFALCLFQLLLMVLLYICFNNEGLDNNGSTNWKASNKVEKKESVQ